MNSGDGQKKHKTGCVVPLVLYVAVCVIAFFITRPPIITDIDAGTTADRFGVAYLIPGGTEYEYSWRRLSDIRQRNPELPVPTFLLPEKEITIYAGDIHRAEVAEDHGEWQLVRFYYSNTYTATSIYRAYADRIEPVSFQVTSGIGDVLVWVLVTAAAIIIYLLAVLVNWIRNRRSR